MNVEALQLTGKPTRCLLTEISVEPKYVVRVGENRLAEIFADRLLGA